MSLNISNNVRQISWVFLNLYDKGASSLLSASSRKRQKLEHLFSFRLTFPQLPWKLQAGVEGKQRSFKMLTSHLPLQLHTGSSKSSVHLQQPGETDCDKLYIYYA